GSWTIDLFVQIFQAEIWMVCDDSLDIPCDELLQGVSIIYGPDIEPHVLFLALLNGLFIKKHFIWVEVVHSHFMHQRCKVFHSFVFKQNAAGNMRSELFYSCT